MARRPPVISHSGWATVKLPIAGIRAGLDLVFEFLDYRLGGRQMPRSSVSWRRNELAPAFARIRTPSCANVSSLTTPALANPPNAH